MEPSVDQIKPETLALIRSQARQMGVPVDEYLRRLLPADQRELALRSDEADAGFDSDMESFAESTDRPPTYNGTYSREDLYADHD